MSAAEGRPGVQVESLDHVSLSVTDIARARAFYTTVLGLPELPRPALPFEGAWFALADRQLHLIVHPPTRTLRGTTEIDGRDGHVALRVADVDAALAHLERLGVPVMENRRNATPWAQLFLTDPDGNVIELNAPREPDRPA